MAKDPRFNFYPDNWNGGTFGFSLEQKGAYLELLMLNFYSGRFTKEQAIRKLSECTLGNAAAYAALWNFLMHKFSTDGNVFWSERLEKEMAKSKKHSLKQAERANKRWAKESGNAAALPDNGNGIGNGIGINNKKESISKLELFEQLFTDDRYIEQLSMAHRGKDIKQAFEECYIHHSNAPNPPREPGEWKQKLNTWLVNTNLNGTSKTRKQTTSDLATSLQNRLMQDAIKQQPGGSG
jgi:uncharacterized protein YdaU (DUF1376 family)